MESATRPWANNPVDFLVVGLGMCHGRSMEITGTSGCRIIGVTDVREGRARRTSEECGVPYKTDFHQWLDGDEIEVVFVLTETGRHAEIGIAALEAGKHVTPTKPMEATLDACDELVRVTEANNHLLAVDFNRRFAMQLITLKEVSSAGKFGRLLNGTNSLKIRRTRDYFRSTRRYGGGSVLSNQSIHHIDMLVFDLGVPDQVRCDVWT